jgi:hypothetical protein
MFQSCPVRSLMVVTRGMDRKLVLRRDKERIKVAQATDRMKSDQVKRNEWLEA